MGHIVQRCHLLSSVSVRAPSSPPICRPHAIEDQCAYARFVIVSRSEEMLWCTGN